jgi:FkbM family methyltransferase
MIKEFNDFCDKLESYSQIRQDLLVLFCLGRKPGYFVEFGACDGIYLSNTFLLETYYGWNGLLVEPSKYYNKILKTKRNVKIDDLCVADKSGKTVKFLEIPGLQGLSGIEEYAYFDAHTETRRSIGQAYDVETISLNDLLDKHNAPEIIDYISIDTEGSELSILQNYDFSRKFKVLTIEHNETVNRGPIEELMKKNGYINILPEESRWDGWFVSQEVFNDLNVRLGLS